MDDVADWTVKIAERVAPNEIDFAAEVGQAYASGGKARAALFPRPGAEPGGFGLTALAGDLPVILRALADSVESLRPLLASRELGNIVAIVTLGVAMRRRKPDDRKTDDGNQSDKKQGNGIQPADGAIVEKPDTSGRAKPVAAPGDASHGSHSTAGGAGPEMAALESAVQQLRERLENDGMPHQQAELYAYELLSMLLSDPEGGEGYLRRLRGE
ncbi:hypothetical protein [Actinomadura macra]|uniref:hypothetical protein n=1 Tax=Actinomadura macra TaxID=46164 RepID=UPI0008312571|nr:hypothetical protein [Actinomadura macra]